MKGVVFTQFVEMVEESFSLEVADHILTTCPLASGGVYTSVGTYDHSEMLMLVGSLSEHSGIPTSDLVKSFGRFLFQFFHRSFPSFFESATSAKDFLNNVDSYIHVEVKKLYPDAQLPKFDIEEHGHGAFDMVYTSARPFADLAHGLIDAALEHFGETALLDRVDLSSPPGTHAKFSILPTHHAEENRGSRASASSGTA
ncbi:MAG: heme NO-binding domain-containing protein [Acidobacteriota bacterium]